MNEKKVQKQTFLQGTAVLAMATILVKLMGFLFKTPLNNIIGSTGFGYFNTAYDVYNVLLMISTTGLPVAMSRMISEAQALLMPRHSPCALSSLTFSIPSGISGSLKFEFELCRLIKLRLLFRNCILP